MNSKTTERFWKCYVKLPGHIKKEAKKSYKLFENDPFHPSLHYKRIHSTRSIFSIRITAGYRAIGIQQDKHIIWFWIGSHNDYDNLIKQIRNA